MCKYLKQLFIMPFAGGSQLSFKNFEKFIDERIEVITIEYPGRGMRRNEPFFDTMDELIQDVKNQIKKSRRSELQFSLMGYSMGCEIAFDLAQYALDEKPKFVILCARESIEFDTRGHDYFLLDQDDFADKMFELGGIDERIRKDKRFLDIALKPIRADYKLLHDYEYKGNAGVLTQDMVVFYCDKDTPSEMVRPWGYHTIGKTDFYELGKNHFFINDNASFMADIISKKVLHDME